MECIDEINSLWRDFKNCSENIQQNTRLAQQLLVQLSEILETTKAAAAIPELPSSEPTVILPTQILTSGITQEDTNAEFMWESGAFQSFTATTVRELWKEWKEGSNLKPSAEFMNEKYGELKWTTSEEEHRTAVVGATIIREIELHLENGRELEEILVVADMILEELGGDMKKLAKRIMDNSERNKATLFETAVSSEVVSNS